MIKVGDYISKDRIFVFERMEKDEVMTALCDAVASSDSIVDKDMFHADIVERENIMSTGIGLGIAIPHAKSDYARDIVIAIGVVKEGVDWGALDNAPVNFVVMIAANTEQHNDYLKVLAKVALVLKSEKKRMTLLNAASVDEIYGVFEGI